MGGDRGMKENIDKIQAALNELTYLIVERNKLVKEPDGNFMDFQTVGEAIEALE